MNKQIHVREFDGALYDVLAKRAKKRGLSLSQFVRLELAKIAKSPPLDEVLEDLVNLPREQTRWKPGEAARLVREFRGERDEHMSSVFLANNRRRKKAK